MPDMELYAVPIPQGGTTSAGSTASQQQTVQAILGSDTGDVQSIASDPGERTLTVEYPDKYAEIRAQELRELATGFSQPLPYHAVGGASPDDRYVTVSRANISPVDPRSTQFQQGDIALNDSGSIASHWRSIRTSIQQVEPLGGGNDTTAVVGVPSAASKVRWFDPETGERADPAVQATRTTRLGDVNILDVTQSPFYDAATNSYPVILMELPYADEGATDPRLWDARGEPSVTDADDNVVWQKCFSTAHEYQGEVVLENGLLRLFFDEQSAPGIRAERWDDAAGAWSSVSLGTSSDWELFDVDIREIGLARVRARVEWQDPTTSPTSYYTLSLRLSRGYADALWARPDNATGPIPSGLETLLDPIASDLICDAQPSMGLVAREEVL